MTKVKNAVVKPIEKEAVATTIIAEGVLLENVTLTGTGILRIDGTVCGNINFDGHIVLGQTGLVRGDITAESAIFAGSYDGNLLIRETLHLAHNAVAGGTIETGRIIVDENAILTGTAVTVTSSANAKKQMATTLPADGSMIPSAAPEEKDEADEK